MTTAEFAAFGPWIDEVRFPDDVPRLYRSYPLDLGSSRLVLKVPRNLSRRDATADMDLYDHLFIVGPDRLTVLSRRGDLFVEAVIAYDEIVAIEDSVDLLDARLTVHAASGAAMTIGYNGSAHRMVDRLVAVLRELILASSGSTRHPAQAPAVHPGPGISPPALRGLGDQDVALVTSQRELFQREPGLRLLAAHGRAVVAPREGALTRALHAARPMNLQGAVLCTDGVELQVLGRRDWFVRGNRPVNSTARLVLPIGRVTRVSARADPRYAGIQIMTIHASGARFDLPVPSGSVAEQVMTRLGAASWL